MFLKRTSLKKRFVSFRDFASQFENFLARKFILSQNEKSNKKDLMNGSQRTPIKTACNLTFLAGDFRQETRKMAEPMNCHKSQIKYLKQIAKKLGKNAPHISLMQRQHLIAKFLGFSKWGELISSKESLIQSRINQKIPYDTFSETLEFISKKIGLEAENNKEFVC